MLTEKSHHRIARNGELFRKYAQEFQSIFKVQLRTYWENDVLGFDVCKFDEEVVQSGRGSMLGKIARKWGERAAAVVEALLN